MTRNSQSNNIIHKLRKERNINLNGTLLIINTFKINYFYKAFTLLSCYLKKVHLFNSLKLHPTSFAVSYYCFNLKLTFIFTLSENNI